MSLVSPTFLLRAVAGLSLGAAVAAPVVNRTESRAHSSAVATGSVAGKTIHFGKTSKVRVAATSKKADVQTLAILGGYDEGGPINTGPTGNSNQYQPLRTVQSDNIDWTNDGGATWQPAYLVGGHPWGYVDGTNSWVNCAPTLWACIGQQVTYRMRFTVPAGFSDASIALQALADNYGRISVNGEIVQDWFASNVGTSPIGLDTQLHTGVNEILFDVYDEGGVAGFNFRADISMTADEPLTQVPNDNGPPPPAPTTTSVSFGPGPFVYTGSAYTATATVSSGGSASISYSGSCTNAGGSCTATASYAGDATHAASSGSATITITPAATTTSVTFGAASQVYSGSAFTATATGSNGTPSISYSGDCTNAGTTCTAIATTAADANHSSSTASTSLTITKATTATSVSFAAASAVYSGSAFNATATTNVGAATIAYSGDCTNAGTTCSATATNAGDANHSGSSAVATLEITKAASSTTVSFGTGPFVYSGTAYTATASVTPAGAATIAYTGDCTNGGATCTATATYAGDLNHVGSNAVATITITYSVCAARGDNDDDEDDDRGGSRMRGHEQGSTLPIKIRVCNKAGRGIGSRALQVKAISLSPAAVLDDAGNSNPGNLFRLDDGNYQYNLSTKSLVAGTYTLNYTIGNDPTVYHYAFVVRAKKSGKDDKKDKDDKKGDR